jgi:hypothetical protein
MRKRTESIRGIPIKEYMRQYREKNRLHLNRSKQLEREVLKREVFAEYGNVCACCPEDRYEFLSIDHIEGGGKNKVPNCTGKDLYRWLRKNGHPKDKFRLLCHNCNQSMGYYGYCPHNLERAVIRAECPQQ